MMNSDRRCPPLGVFFSPRLEREEYYIYMCVYVHYWVFAWYIIMCSP